MAFISIRVKEHKITPQDVDARNEPSESNAPIYNEGRHSFEWREVGVAGAGGDMRKDTYDRTDSGVVDNSEALEGYTLTQVRDHVPKGHDNTQHIDNFLTTCNKYSKEFMDILGIDAAGLEDYDLAGVRTHVPLTHSNDYHSTAFLTTCNKYTKTYMNLLGINAATLGGKTLGVGVDNIVFYDANGRVADVTKVMGTTVDSTNIGVGKLLAYDATTETLLYKTLTELVPALNTAGKLILTGSDQIGTKTCDLAELWDKTTKLTTADFEATEFDQPNKIPTLDASTFLALSQVIGNVPGLSGTGKLILTQAGTKVADLADIWDKTTELVTTDFDDATFNVANGMVKLDAGVKVPYTTVPEVGGAATFVVSASDSLNKDKADYVCTGTDDQGKVMEAIIALPANGGSIVLLEGTYTIDADNDPVKVNTQNNVTIQGQGKGTKLCLDTGISSNIIEVSNASGVTIKDLYVNGTTTAISGGDDLKQCGVIFITVTDSKVKNVHTLSNKMYGINLITASERNIVMDCICYGNKYEGICIDTSSYNIVLNNTSTESTTGGGVASFNGSNNTIIGNSLESNIYGVLLDSASENNTIMGNTCSNNSNQGVYVYSSIYNTIAGNACCENGLRGIELQQVSNYNILFGNTVSGNTNYGIYLPWGDSSVIAGNICHDNAGAMGICSWSEGGTITGNECSENGSYGIAILDYGMNIASSNSAYKNGSYGMLIYDTSGTTLVKYNTIVGNTLKENDTFGMFVFDSDYNTINKNTSIDNMTMGIDLYLASNNTLSSNLSASNSQETTNLYPDVNIRANSDYNNIQKNTCRAGSGTNVPRYGISIWEANCTENFVTNNDIHDDGFGTESLYIAVGSGTVTTPGNRTA